MDGDRQGRVAGGGTLIPPRRYWKVGATFSACRTWRYTLWRTWGTGGRIMAVCSLNPSTADEHEDDPTVRRDVAFAQRWGFDGLVKLNLFSFRSTDPCGLLAASDPIGADNDRHLREVASTVDRVVMAWGSHRKSAELTALVAARARVVERMLRECALDIGTFGSARNADGQPKHPLYLKSTTEFVRVVR